MTPGPIEGRAEIGLIGGSGFYSLDGLAEAERISVPTPFGEPSSPIVLGTLGGRRIAFLSRHDEGHRLLPGELPARANIWAMKSLGVQRLLAVSAVGSLQERIEPLHAVVPDQLLDRTSGRASTFFGDGIVAHVGFADPFCPEAGAVLALASETTGVATHRGGTLLVIEGPAFSTRAESELYRLWGAAIIGMTALPEAKLAREAELCYALICYVTDYDVWHETEADVSAELVMQRLSLNAAHAHETVRRAIEVMPTERGCVCGDALSGALVTATQLVPVATRRRLAPLLDRYWREHP